MNILGLMADLDTDADLVTRSDEWLEAERRSTAHELDRITRELRAIMTAQRIKTALQQKNMVAAQQILRDTDGEIKSVLVRFMNLPDALVMFQAPPRDEVDELNREAQLYGWDRDGYDIPASAALR